MKHLPGTEKTKAVFKQSPEDFFVEEILPFTPSNSGNHHYYIIEKTSLSTFEAVDAIADFANVPRNSIGYAGLKDKQAVTRQTISLEKPLENFHHPSIKLLSHALHPTKLKIGKLYGNRFRIVLREVENPSALKEEFEKVCKKGIPNTYGPQRFGTRGNNHDIGKLLLKKEFAEALALFLSGTGNQEAYARELSSKMPPEKVWRKISRRIPSLLLNSLQSRLFNQVLEKRKETFSTLIEGDLAMVGSRFSPVTDLSAFPSYAVPSGPLFGRKVKLASGLPGQIELEVLSSSGLTLEDFASSPWPVQGYRRPLALTLTSPKISIKDQTATLEFTLRKGSYATSVISALIG